MDKWQQLLAKGFSEPAGLLAYLNLESALVASDKASQAFAMRVPLGFAKKMRKADKDCPLLKQVLPEPNELVNTVGFQLDPLQEKAANSVQGLLHKYYGRVLVTLTGSCAINCRYCFRRHFSYHDNQISSQSWQAIIDYISADPSITEVILSGGDPLLVKNHRLEYYLSSLAAISHLQTLRIHSRIPIVLPERIDNGLIAALDNSRLQKVLVVHANHPAELCSNTAKGFEQLAAIGVHLLNQSVLLKGVNDSAAILAQLSQALFKQKVLPYYLHLLDKVQGTAHFEVSSEQAKQIYQALQGLLPGYLVPKLAREEPAYKYKLIVGSKPNGIV